jgi:hypothetical protein
MPLDGYNPTIDCALAVEELPPRQELTVNACATAEAKAAPYRKKQKDSAESLGGWGGGGGASDLNFLIYGGEWWRS